MNKPLPARKHPRLKNYDYSSAGAYFVTICTQNRKTLLSTIVGRGLAPAEVNLSSYGKIAQEELLALEKRYTFLKIDHYVIMPNHIHAILIIKDDPAGASPRPTVADIVCAYKSITTAKCKKYQPIQKLFQTSFYDHVIRNREDYYETVRYIMGNPSKWLEDSLYCKE